MVEEITVITPVEINFHTWPNLHETTELTVNEVTQQSGDEVTSPDWLREADESIPFSEIDLTEVSELEREFYQNLKKIEVPDLTNEQEEILKTMLWYNRIAFSLHPEDIGSVADLILHLRMKDDTPVQKTYNSIPRPLYPEVREHIMGMLHRGWIQRSESEWASPIVLAAKKSGGFRLCCDYRAINNQTIKDKHPIPKVNDTLENLMGAKYFSTLDFSRAYYQGYLSPESRNRSAFVTPFGFFEWIRIPFGLSNAVPVFQRYMENLLSEYRDTFATPYLDDTIVFSKTIEEHIEHLRKILKLFISRGLKLNLTKCSLFRIQVKYLGRIVTKDGYKMDERNILSVTALRDRTFNNTNDIRKLMGILGFHRRSIPNFARLAKPITDLLVEQPSPATKLNNKKKKGTGYIKRKIEWKTEQQEALNILIELATSQPLLGYPDYSRPFYLNIDASGTGLGCMLYQKYDETYKVIAYGSRTLRPAERNYHSTKLEFLGLYWSVTKHFKNYLAYANEVHIYTDNNPLSFIMQISKPNVTIQRWISELAEYTFQLHYKPGVENGEADGLSRLPIDVEKYAEQCTESTTMDVFQQQVASVQLASVKDGETSGDEAEDVIEEEELEDDENDIITDIPDNAIETWDLKSEQEEDSMIKPVRDFMEGKSNTEPLSTESKLLLREKNRLYIDENGVLRRKYKGLNQVILPLKRRDDIYRLLHCEMGHMGANRVSQLAKLRVFWPHMDKEIQEFAQKKCWCLTQRITRQQAVAPMIPILASRPMEIVGYDYLHLEKSTSGQEYILVIVDHFTRYAQAYATSTKRASAAAKVLYNDFFLRFGFPSRVLTDQGREFQNTMFQHLEKYVGIIKSRTTPYHPETNGLVERHNGTLLHMLRTLPEKEKGQWPAKLNKMMFSYNSTQHSSTGFTPFRLMFGREAVLPIDWLLDNKIPRAPEMTRTYDKLSSDWVKQMTEVHQQAKRNSEKSKAYNVDLWKRKKESQALAVGDRVLVKNRREIGGPGKLRARFEQEIYEVLERKANGVVYVVRKMADKKGEKRTLHRNFLLPCGLLESNGQRVGGRPSSQKDGPTPKRKAKAPEIASDSEESEDEEWQLDKQMREDNSTIIIESSEDVDASEDVVDSEDATGANNDSTAEPVASDPETLIADEAESYDESSTSIQVEEETAETNTEPVSAESGPEDQPESATEEKSSSSDQSDGETTETFVKRGGLRSQGRVLDWNREMGGEQVVVESQVVNSKLVNEVSPKCQGEGSTSIFTIESDDEFIVIENEVDGEGSSSQIDDPTPESGWKQRWKGWLKLDK